jgi:hypothetical protein
MRRKMELLVAVGDMVFCGVHESESWRSDTSSGIGINAGYTPRDHRYAKWGWLVISLFSVASKLGVLHFVPLATTSVTPFFTSPSRPSFLPTS